ncbi:MAG: spore germination protein [Oscillospiraceae bacterium]|nr:spore germination protein [Oscillospiraceae bacterium]
MRQPRSRQKPRLPSCPWLWRTNFHRASVQLALAIFAFFISIFLPGLYVAVANFNPELIPLTLLFNIVEAQRKTPMPLMYEALFITVVYEIVREAGLRLPRPVGHAVSLVGALVVGDAAVTAGIIGSPMVMIVALTAISSFTIPMLHEPITVLRYVFIVIGGLLGPVGISIGLCLLLLNICSINTYGVPYTVQLSPFSKTLFSDGFVKKGWRSQAKDRVRLRDLNGVQLKGDGDAH